MVYDIIIVGSGIAGLYTAYNIKKMYPKLSFLILEKNTKKNIGGRMNNYNFKGTNVNIGAGVGREKKDNLLINLLKELNINYSTYSNIINYSNNINRVDINYIFDILKKKYNYEKKTFKEFALPILGLTLYNDLIVMIGYSDFENEDIYEVLYHYGIEDAQAGWTCMKILWLDLLNKLILNIGYKNIKTSNNVKSIKNNNEFYYIYTDKYIYITKKIIIASTIDTVKKLLPKYTIYNQIYGQPFLRVYGQFSKSSIPIISKYVTATTIVSSELKKIIPITSDIYMIAYTDNNDALYFKENNRLINNTINKNFYCRLIEKSLGIIENSLELVDIKSFYWKIGTHYFEPLSNEYKNREEFIIKAQNPIFNIFVVGEMISRNQGWTLGALESVEKILNII